MRAVTGPECRPTMCIVAAFVLALGSSACSKKTVEVVSPKRGTIQESFSEPARTRLAHTYPITMPVAGRIFRVRLDPGDDVRKGQVLVKFDRLPLKKAVEQARAQVAELKAEIEVNKNNEIEKTAIIETQAAIDAAKEALKASKQQIAAECARAERAEKHRNRMLSLSRSKAIPQSELEDAELAADTALIELRRQQFYHEAFNALMVAIKLGPQYVRLYIDRKELQRDVIEHKLEQARAQLERAEHDLKLARIVSPIDGVVLERFDLGDSTLPAGHKLLLLGDLEDLEVIADVLTQDALKLRKNDPVELRPGRGGETIAGRVDRVEPAGFTKLSSLGVEQQRVNVIVAFEAPHDRLGAGYRVRARFVTASKDDALLVPRFSVLQSPQRDFYVYKVVRGKLKRQQVKLGLRSDLKLEIVDGLTQNDAILARPDSEMGAGMSVETSR